MQPPPEPRRPEPVVYLVNEIGDMEGVVRVRDWVRLRGLPAQDEECGGEGNTDGIE